jgi:hypothetical protein
MHKELTVRLIPLAALGLMAAGCAYAPSAPRVMVPPPQTDASTTPAAHEAPVNKPMPRDVYETQLPPPPFEDAPILTEPTPEQAAFVDTYNRVGRPRISILLERPANQGNDDWAKSFDDEALRTELTDWLACSGQVTLVTLPAANDQSHAAPDTDVIIHVQAHPTQQYPDGMRIRLLAEASNTKDGVSIGRAFVDIPPPLDKSQINRYTRWLARKLMDDMTASWLAPDPANPGDKPAPPPAPQTQAPQTQPPPTTAPER